MQLRRSVEDQPHLMLIQVRLAQGEGRDNPSLVNDDCNNYLEYILFAQYFILRSLKMPVATIYKVLGMLN